MQGYELLQTAEWRHSAVAVFGCDGVQGGVTLLPIRGGMGCLPGPPFVGGDLPNLRLETTTDVILFANAYHAHALLLRYAAGGKVGGGFGNAQTIQAEDIEPEVACPFTGFAHIPAPLEFRGEPEAAIFVFAPREIDVSNEFGRHFAPTQGPVPGFAALHLGQGDFTNELLGAVRRVGPRHARGKILDDLPLGEERLDGWSIGEFQRMQEEARCLALGDHNAMIATRLVNEISAYPR